MSLRIFFIIALTITVLCSCSQRDTPEPLQAINLDGFLPIVREQIATAYSASEKKPRSEKAYGHLGMVLHVYEQYPAATQAYERALMFSPKNAKWAYLLGDVHSKQGNTDAAIALFTQARQFDPEYLSASVQLADQLLLSGRFEESRATLEHVLSKNPELAEAHFYLGELEMRQGNGQRAIEHYERAVQLSEGASVAHYGLAIAYRSVNEAAQAEHHFNLSEKYVGRKATRVDPWLQHIARLDLSDTSLIKRAEQFGMAGRFDEALEMLNEAIRRNPKSLSGHTSLVGLHATLGQFAQADDHYKLAFALQPDHPKLHYNLGIARMQERRLVEASRAFEKALSLESGYADAHVQLAVVRRSQGKIDAAIAEFEKALTLKPLHRQGNWQLGDLLIEQADYAAGAEYLNRVADIEDPASPSLFYALGQANLQLGLPDQAEIALTNAVRTAGVYGNAQVGTLAKRKLRELKNRDEKTP